MQDREGFKVMGFYEPHDQKATDFTNSVKDPITGKVSHPPSMTKQEFVAECDINNIIKEYLQTGQVAHISARAAQGAFEDLPDPMDFQEAVSLVHAAGESFAQLPARVRDRFGNNPQAFLEFTADPANVQEMVDLGLALPKPQEAQETPPRPSPGGGGGGGGEAPQEPKKPA